MLDYFKTPYFVTILVTGYDFYAIEAIKKNALDYILKPIVINELITAVEKAKKKIKELTLLEDLEKIRNIEKVDSEKIIIQKTKEQLKVINPQEIIYIEAQNQYTKWHLINEPSILIRKPLSNYKNILPTYFCQIHRSYIVNLNLVTDFDKGRGGFYKIKYGSTSYFN